MSDAPQRHPSPTIRSAGPDAGTSAGMLLVISGPSGVGKTTITRAIERAFSDAIFSVSATTRPPTSKDRPGIDYHFISDVEFDALVAQDAFLEWANVFGKRYGTLRRWVLEQLVLGRLVILEIDVQGAINIKRQIPSALAMFILPPDEAALLARLRARRREPEEAIQRRFAEATREIAQAKSSGVYDHFIVNQDLEQAIAQAADLVQQRRLNPPKPA